MAEHTQRLFVDCQVFQYNTWNRGMGRYTLKLLDAIDKEAIELTLIFNKSIGIDKERLKVVERACPSATMLFLELSNNPNRPGGWLKLQEVCATELDAQLKDIVKPTDTYLIASHFALRYCSAFPNFACKKALIFYDLIPYLHWNDYKHTPDFEPQKYFAQFRTLFDADQLWAISQSAADEAEDWLGIDTKRVINIRGASIRNIEESARRPRSVAAAHFILSPSADGPIKNNENMVRAFADFNSKNGGKYKLVITSDFSDQSKTTLGAISKDIIFSGHVSDGELSWLYEHCDAVLFVSKTEGLGLPILEAIGANKKVVCSDIKVFKEISEEALYFSNPSSPQSIAEALDEALVQEKGWKHKNKYYADISRKFSWDTTAQTCLDIMDSTNNPPSQLKYQQNQVIWYADSDAGSVARDVAEILYPLNQAAELKAMRDIQYTYNFPSYLVDMGVAAQALEGQRLSQASKQLYIVDDSQEGARLLLLALQIPGLIVTTFQTKRTPAKIEKYLKDTFENKLTYNTLVSLLSLAGNDIVYTPGLSSRGSRKFINEVAALNQRITRGEV